MKYFLLYRGKDWRSGNPALSAHETQAEAKAEALRQARLTFGDNPALSLECMAASSFVIAYAGSMPCEFKGGAQ